MQNVVHIGSFRTCNRLQVFHKKKNHT